MSLESPNLFERAADAVRMSQYPKIYVCVGLLIVLGAVLFTFDRCGGWNFKRGLSKDKQKVVNTVNEIKNINTQIANLQMQESEKRGELKRDVEVMQDNIFGLDEAKKESNAALANFNKALAANSNNATVAEIEAALKKLEGQ